MDRLENQKSAGPLHFDVLTGRRGWGFLGGRQMDGGEYDSKEIAGPDSPILGKHCESLTHFAFLVAPKFKNA